MCSNGYILRNTFVPCKSLTGRVTPAGGPTVPAREIRLGGRFVSIHLFFATNHQWGKTIAATSLLTFGKIK